ncbi:MAG: oligosaccharide flippase family protein [Candidatus Omnitrophica bacterium]|nr:oligosaccharide flippase family protein [Candidatus Omnitrophota bacterium]
MTSKEKQIKNSFIYILPVIVGNLIPILTLPIFTRILTPADYGIWALAQVYAIFVNGVANFGLTIGYERNFFEYKETKNVAGLLYSTLLFVIITFIVCGFFTYLFKHQLSRLIIGSADYANILFWSYCATGVVGLKAYFLIYFKNTENAKAFTWYTIDENLLGVLFSLFMVAYLRSGVVGLIWGQLLASFIIFSILSIRFVRFLPVSFDWGALKDSLKISLPLTPRIFFGVIGNQFDKYMIGLLNTVGGVGIYNIGQKVVNVLFTYMTAIQNVFSPQVYRRMFEMGSEGGKSVGRYLTPFMYISIAIGLMISLFSEEIISILTPKSYHGAIEVVTILSMLYGSYFFGKQPQLIFAKKTHITSMLTIVSIGLNILINIPFILKWGAVGAAWGTLLAGLISGTISFIVSQRYYEIKWEYGKVSAIFLIFFGSAVIMILLRNFGISYGVRVIVKLMSLAGYLYLGMKLNILTRQNYLLVKNMFSPVKDSLG